MLEHQLSQATAQLLADTAGVTGEPFYAALAKSLARNLGTRWGFVGEFVPGGRVRVIAGCDGDTQIDPMYYDLPGSPCEQVHERGVCAHPRGVADAFPEDTLLRDMGAESYFGVCVHSADGQPLGLINALHDSPKEYGEGHRRMLELFALRVGAELERQNMDRQLLRTQKLESLGVLAGGIAHDFNNLLVGILGNVELAAAFDLPPEARQALQDAARSSRAAADLTRQLLAYSGRHDSERKPIAIESHVRETVQMLAHMSAAERDISITIEPELPSVFGDASQLRQVVMNLTSNAFEAMEGHPGAPAIDVKRVPPHAAIYEACMFLAPTFQRDSEHVAISVTDSGVGMSAEAKRLAFDPFYTSKATGRGLGLSAVMGILRNHDAAIAVESEPGRGTTMTVLLPTAMAKPERVSQPEQKVDADGKRVLVVDDNDIVRVTLVRTLERIGCDVTAVENGPAALRAVESEAPFDCLIIDRVMPHMNGPQLIRQLRDNGIDTPIVLTTGFSDGDDVASDLISGVLNKPWTAPDVQAMLLRALGGE